jgi:hypothetical protein
MAFIKLTTLEQVEDAITSRIEANNKQIIIARQMGREDIAQHLSSKYTAYVELLSMLEVGEWVEDGGK